MESLFVQYRHKQTWTPIWSTRLRHTLHISVLCHRNTAEWSTVSFSWKPQLTGHYPTSSISYFNITYTTLLTTVFQIYLGVRRLSPRKSEFLIQTKDPTLCSPMHDKTARHWTEMPSSSEHILDDTSRRCSYDFNLWLLSSFWTQDHRSLNLNCRNLRQDHRCASDLPLSHLPSSSRVLQPSTWTEQHKNGYRKISNTIRTIFTKNRGPEAGVRIIHLN